MGLSKRTLCWFSCGAASAVAAKFEPTGELVYCDTGSEHTDNVRFLADVELWLNREVTVLKSEKYVDTWDVWQRERWLAGIEGAHCTGVLKVEQRLVYQKPDDIHVFGYTADGPDIARAKRLRANYPELVIKTPLIDRGINKAACLALIERAGIKLPAMYLLGFWNNNCIPCPKATSPNYWALVRKCFPDRFFRMAKLSRDLNVKLTRLHGERVFIDEIPEDWPTTEPIAPACDFLCHIAESEAAE
ncbi:hypothetical protein [Roseibium sp.]|uniref:hypothetical protein n=1 Tax=Roseibium sp. TaxID=1936156 RepID=UPI003B51E9F7